jgi:hypothetical protein
VRLSSGAADDSRLSRRSIVPSEKAALKRRSASVAPRVATSFFEPPSAPKPESPIRPGEGLASLSRALERLAQAAPERPNTGTGPRPSTSLGFVDRGTTEADSDDDDVPERLSARSKGKARADDTSHRPSGSGAGAGALKRPAVTPTPGSSAPPHKRRLSIGASGASAIPVRTPAAVGTSSTATFKTPVGPAATPKLLAGVNKVTAALGGAARNPFSQAARVPVPKKLFGAGQGFGSTGVMGARIAARASRPTSLPMVEASPVKGADTDAVPAGGADDRLEAPAFAPADGDVEMNEPGSAPGENAPPPLRRNASMRASRAMQSLSESLADAAAPHTPPTAVPPPTSTRQTRTRGAGAGAMGPPAAPVSGAGGSPAGESSAAGAGAARVSRRGGAKRPEQTLGVLSECTVFLDVRTDDGDDASEAFAQMLQVMGARVSLAGGSVATHGTNGAP